MPGPQGQDPWQSDRPREGRPLSGQHAADPAPPIRTRRTHSAEEEIQALRSTVHRPHRRLPRWVAPLLLVVLVFAAVLGAQATGLIDLSAIGKSAPTTTQPTDIATEVRQALASAGLDSIDVAVSGDVVTLRGSVSDGSTLEAAEAAAFSVSGVATVDNQIRVGSSTDDALKAGAADVLNDPRYRGVIVTVQDGVVVLSGVVETDDARSAAAAKVRAVPGAEKVANRLTIGTIPAESEEPTATVSDDELRTRVVETLKNAGFQSLDVSVSDGDVLVQGVVPLGVLEDGFFEYSHRIEATVLNLGGVNGVATQMRLRGDEGILRSELRDLIEASPVVFDSGSSELSAESRNTLDQAAAIILSQPGLQVFIAGYTDQVGSSSVNEQIAGQRAGAVYTYLISRGVPPSRLAVVAYGELFPEVGPSEQSRRIEFEVGP